MRWSLLPIALLAVVLTACPEERPGVTKEVPPQRVPPAMSLEPPTAARPPSPADAGTIARPQTPLLVPVPGPSPTSRDP